MAETIGEEIANYYLDGDAAGAVAEKIDAAIAEARAESQAIRQIFDLDWLQDSGAIRERVRLAMAMERSKCKGIVDAINTVAGNELPNSPARTRIMQLTHALDAEELKVPEDKELVAFVFRAPYRLSTEARHSIRNDIAAAYKGTKWENVPVFILPENATLDLMTWPPKENKEATSAGNY